jgi:hypothetical protein
MENPEDRIQELQDIQFRIIAFINQYTENAGDDNLALALRQAVTELNLAKTIILDRAISDGTMVMHHHGKATTDKLPDGIKTS